MQPKTGKAGIGLASDVGCNKFFSGDYMLAKKDSCIHKMVCFRWNGYDAESECIADCLHHTKVEKLTTHNKQSEQICSECKQVNFCHLKVSDSIKGCIIVFK